jgi:leader peptidase (prepilin peptidase)/N-methyltransferase
LTGDLPAWAGPAAAFVTGLMFGSFANVCIHRIPAEESIVTPRSRCPGCGTLIRWYDNVPILSWLLLRARCRSCGAAISPIYPFIEGLTGLAFLAAYLVFGPTIDGAAAAWLAFTCIVLAAIDLRHFLLPDALTLTGLAAGLLFSIARATADRPAAIGEWLGGIFDEPVRPLAALTGAAAGAAIPLLARALYRLYRGLARRVRPEEEVVPATAGAALSTGAEAAPAGEDAPPPEGPAGSEEEDVAVWALEEGMGLGDVKMLAMAGSFLGMRLTFVTILAGSLLGCLIVLPWLALTRRGFRTPVPFGPFLAAGAVLAMFAGGPLVDAYTRFLRHWIA